MSPHLKEVVIFVIGGNLILGNKPKTKHENKKLQDDSAHVFRRNESSAVLTICIGYIPTHLLCSYMWQNRWERMKCCWKRPLFLFPLKAAFFSSPTHFFLSPSTSKADLSPVCHVTCLPKGSFQINSSSPWDACPSSLRAFQRHNLLKGGRSKRKHTFLNLDIISRYCRSLPFVSYSFIEELTSVAECDEKMCSSKKPKYSELCCKRISTGDLEMHENIRNITCSCSAGSFFITST